MSSSINLERWKAKKQQATAPIYSNIPVAADNGDEEDLPLPPPPIAYSPPKNQSFPDPPELPDSDSQPGKWEPSNSNAVYSSAGGRPRSSASTSTYDVSIYEPISAGRPSSQLSQYSTASGASSLYSASNYYPSSSHRLQSNPVSATEQVTKLTDLLVKSMENSNDPDFFGMCYHCGGKVLGEGNGCSAMNQIYHIKCFTCNTCNKELRGLSFYNVDGKPLCEEDYLNTLEKCSVCSKPILDRILRATGKPYHPDCFSCIVCGKCLDGIPFTVDNQNRIHCIEDFHKKFAPRCHGCKLPILPEPGQQETMRIVACDKSYHVNCYRCEDCGTELTSKVEGGGCYPLDDHILCRHCNAARVRQLTAAQ